MQSQALEGLNYSNVKVCLSSYNKTKVLSMERESIVLGMKNARERKLDQNPHYLVWNGGSPFYSGDLVFHKSKS